MSAKALLVAVFLGMSLGRLGGVVSGMLVMSAGGVGVMRSRLVVTGLVVRLGLPVVLSCLLMVLRSLPVVFRGLL